MQHKYADDVNGRHAQWGLVKTGFGFGLGSWLGFFRLRGDVVALTTL